MNASFDESMPRKYVLNFVLSSFLSRNVSSSVDSITNSRRLETSKEESLKIAGLSVFSIQTSESTFQWTASFVVAVKSLVNTGLSTKEDWAASVESVLTSDAFNALAVLALGDLSFAVTDVDLSEFTSLPTPSPTQSPTPVPSPSNLLPSEAIVAVVGAAVAASVAAR